MMAVTIRDVARRLKLSITTVSRALDGYPDVAAATRHRVDLVAKEMGYVPNHVARQLRRRRTDILGFVLPATAGHFSDAFFSEFIAGLGEGATAHGFELLVSTAQPDTDAERQLYTRWVQSRLVDGVVLNRMRLHDWRVAYLSHEGIPFVAHGRTRLNVDFPFIDMDSRTGIALLVEHLVGRGYRRIGYIGAPPGTTLQADRSAGYRDGLRAAGLPFDTCLRVRGDLTHRGGYEGARRLLELPELPTAIIGANDLTAIGAMRAIHERGLAVGRDIAVAGYDGTEDAAHAQPPLTTLKQPIFDTAKRLADLLIARLTGQRLEQWHFIMKPELIIRASTGR
jgi:LacI family transcriptional regulator